MPKYILAAPVVLLCIVLGTVALSGICFAQSPSDCDAYARRVEMDSGSVLGGAARGAAGGALFGAIVGGGKGAGRGAALGGVLGGAHKAGQRSSVYRRAYDDCMAGRVKW